MSAVATPPGLEIEGIAAGEFVAPNRKRRLAVRVFWFVAIAGTVTALLAARHPHREGAHVLFSAPLFLLSVALLGWAVRTAKIAVEPTAVRWGWSSLGFRMDQARIRSVKIYADAVALRPNRGSIWYLSRGDWQDFDRLGRVLRSSKLPVETVETSAPLWARAQSYGRVLDALLILDAGITAVALFAAIVG